MSECFEKLQREFEEFITRKILFVFSSTRLQHRIEGFSTEFPENKNFLADFIEFKVVVFDDVLVLESRGRYGILVFAE